jgi:hypothetical protein
MRTRIWICKVHSPFSQDTHSQVREREWKVNLKAIGQKHTNKKSYWEGIEDMGILLLVKMTKGYAGY